MVQFFGIAAVACTPNLLMATIVSSVFYGEAYIAATGLHSCLQTMTTSLTHALIACSLHTKKTKGGRALLGLPYACMHFLCMQARLATLAREKLERWCPVCSTEQPSFVCAASTLPCVCPSLLAVQ